MDKDSEDIGEYFPSTDDTMTLIDSMWRSRSKKIIAKSIPILYEFLKEQIEKGETQGRPFRYCINRFKTLISSNLFASKSILAQDIADSLINEFESQPVSTDQFCKLLKDIDLTDDHLKRIADYLVDEMVAIHCWQNYQILLLLAHKGYDYQPLIDHCKRLISTSIERAEVPACFIYLASIGKENEVEAFIKLFEETWSYQHQRYFLIALQNTPVARLKPLFGKVGYRLKGTVDRLRSNKNFKGETVYLRDFNQTLITDIYDEISPYE